MVAGNWKMNGLKSSSAELLKIIEHSVRLARSVDILVCPPVTLLTNFVALSRGSRVRIGAQDCHPQPAGSFTGDISAEMLKDAGASAIIVGHSERRTVHKETDAEVRAKTLAVWRAGITAIVCIGETRAEREARQTLDVVRRQIDGSLPNGGRSESLLVAYEPVWAIGTGQTPTPADIAEVHTAIRRRLVERFGSSAEGIRILYGGSVRPDNAKSLLTAPNVDGALVGGASLKADEFLGIIAAYQ
jgi:triosephosphate isomerase (TIM)